MDYKDTTISSAKRLQHLFINEGPQTVVEIYNHFGLTSDRPKHSGQKVVARARKGGLKVERKYFDKEETWKYTLPNNDKTVRGIELDNIFDAMGQLSKAQFKEEKYTGAPEVLSIEGERILIIILADLHFGPAPAHYKLINMVLEHAKLDGVYFITLGDLIDYSACANSPTDSHNMVDGEMQVEVMTRLLERIGWDNQNRHKVRMMIEGNHEGRAYRMARREVTKSISETLDTHFGHYSKPFYIKMPDRSYRIFAGHRLPGSSQYHCFQGQFRAPQYKSATKCRDADIILSAHIHEAGSAYLRLGQKRRKVLTCPSIVRWDMYAERMGFDTTFHTGISAFLLRKGYRPRMYPFDYRWALKEYWNLSDDGLRLDVKKMKN